MITERTLRQWRKDALKKQEHSILIKNGEETNMAVLLEYELHNRILRLTQELLDIHLMRRS
jgi:hypothetical protein